MSMDQALVEELVKKIVSEQLRTDVSKISPSTRFAEDLGADSLDRVELIMKLEEKFGVEIGDRDAEQIVSIQDAVNYIKEHAPQA